MLCARPGWKELRALRRRSAAPGNGGQSRRWRVTLAYPVTLGGSRLARTLTMAVALLTATRAPSTAGGPGTSPAPADAGEPGGSTPGVTSAMFASVPGAAFLG